MNSLLLISASILLALIVGAMFLPLLRGNYQGAFFYRMGGGRGKHLQLQRRILIENLRDIAIEKDGAKLDGDEFESLAGPLNRELEKVEQDLDQGKSPLERRTSSGHFCPACGARDMILSPANGVPYCEQCGTEFSALSS